VSVVKNWSVECDLALATDCEGDVGDEDTMKEARTLAEGAGWHKAVVDGHNRDVCPACYRFAFEERARGKA
jgi:hypothetical protein